MAALGYPVATSRLVDRDRYVRYVTRRIPTRYLWLLSGVCVVVSGILIVSAVTLDGLTQPEATITTGVLAICAAGVAFLGVNRQVLSNERISAQNRAAEAEGKQRAELLEVVRDTITGMTELTSSLIDLNNSRRAFVLDGPPTVWADNTYKAVEARLTASWALLSALGHPALATKLGELLGHANNCVKQGDEPTASNDDRLKLIERWYEPYTEAWAQMLASLQQLLGEESNTSLQPLSWNPRAS